MIQQLFSPDTFWKIPQNKYLRVEFDEAGSLRVANLNLW